MPLDLCLHCGGNRGYAKKFCSPACWQAFVRRPEQIAARFWTSVEKTDGCWIWHGQIRRDGYGTFNVDGRNVRAHRFAFELGREPTPTGLDLDHLCRNRRCVNPAHLEPVTRGENLRRSPLTGPGRNIRKVVCERAGHELTRGRNGKRRCVTCANEQRTGRCTLCGGFYAHLRQHLTIGRCRNRSAA